MSPFRGIPPLTVLLVGLALSASSCRLDSVSPVRDAPAFPHAGAPDASVAAWSVDGDDGLAAAGSQVPRLAMLRGDVRGDTLYLKGMMFPRNRRAPALSYDPDHAGGWALQLFVDADPEQSPYWLGYESIVRGVEWNRARGTFVIRRITLDDDAPGGWGPATGEARFRLKPMSFELAVPLASLGGSNGRLQFAIETYATTACPDCDSGITQDFSEDYFGAVTHPGGAVAFEASSVASIRGIARGTHSAVADLRLAGVALR